jgi:hypothetical protein
MCVRWELADVRHKEALQAYDHAFALKRNEQAAKQAISAQILILKPK